MKKNLILIAFMAWSSWSTDNNHIAVCKDDKSKNKNKITGVAFYPTTIRGDYYDLSNCSSSGQLLHNFTEKVFKGKLTTKTNPSKKDIVREVCKRQKLDLFTEDCNHHKLRSEFSRDRSMKSAIEEFLDEYPGAEVLTDKQ